ncbi:hypothetical protein D8M04_07450 [Oceanobacillus piezotolerans]|uniref:FAD synthase n=1 Tax=Oceanobacillus piezotolerans TaxID=2448030 RepID=A0A498DBS3_9BACI|nr:FAD synthetase family protein [Oceanobacillus piezotolerans]RLL47018.1 hypothetical protein D8M04_07450 [Oceanobacillus piezotolerans]
MRTIHLNSSNLEEFQKDAIPNVMALGFFDGIHNGHQKVIHTAREIARKRNLPLAVMSFFPHPKTVLSKDDSKFDYLMSLSKKSSILESLNVDIFYIVKFDKDFCSLLPEQFVSSYLLDMQVNHAVAGFDFSYGHRGAGKVDSLKRDSGDLIEVTKVKEVDYQGEKISSTWIRQLISEGKMEQLMSLLGRFYETEVYWEAGNLRVSEHFMLPAPGIYKAGVTIKGERWETEVLVPKNRMDVYLAEQGKYHFLPNEKLGIIWYYRIPIAKETEGENISII